jgi:pimeloyl-ACP methyl ester carboxylesterase
MTSLLFDEVRKNDGRVAQLRELEIPFQLIWGDIDPYLNMGVAADLAAKLKKASVAHLHCGHWPQIDEPEDVARAMLAAF